MKTRKIIVLIGGLILWGSATANETYQWITTSPPDVATNFIGFPYPQSARGTLVISDAAWDAGNVSYNPTPCPSDLCDPDPANPIVSYDFTLLLYSSPDVSIGISPRSNPTILYNMNVDLNFSNIWTLNGGLDIHNIDTEIDMYGTGTNWEIYFAGTDESSGCYSPKCTEATTPDGYWAFVPEPSSIALFGIAACALGWSLRRKLRLSWKR